MRTGNLDFYLLKPIDEQFLVSLRKIDWSTAPKLLLGVTIMAVAMALMGWSFNPLDLPSALAGVRWTFEPGRVIGFAALFACGVALAYSFLLLLSSTSVWLVRNENLMELWWLFTTLMRYPRGDLQRGWSYPSTRLLVRRARAAGRQRAGGPAGAGAWSRGTSPFSSRRRRCCFSLSRRFFFYALRSYSSASS